MKTAKLILIILGIFIFILFSPAASWCFNGGNIVGMALGALIVLLGIFLFPVCRFVRFLAGRWQGIVLLSVVGAVLVFALTLAGIASVRILRGASKTDADCKAIIVLGCNVKNGKPGTMLTGRLDAAYDWLCGHPSGVAILSGGQGPDEAISEAAAMYEYLTDKGIAAERLFTESESESTEENILFSRRIMEEKGLGNKIATVTQSFHQYRASVMAERYGFEWSAINADTPVFVYPTYFLREVCGIMLMLLGLY